MIEYRTTGNEFYATNGLPKVVMTEGDVPDGKAADVTTCDDGWREARVRVLDSSSAKAVLGQINGCPPNEIKLIRC